MSIFYDKYCTEQGICRFVRFVAVNGTQPIIRLVKEAKIVPSLTQLDPYLGNYKVDELAIDEIQIPHLDVPNTLDINDYANQVIFEALVKSGINARNDMALWAKFRAVSGPSSRFAWIMKNNAPNSFYNKETLNTLFVGKFGEGFAKYRMIVPFYLNLPSLMLVNLDAFRVVDFPPYWTATSIGRAVSINQPACCWLNWDEIIAANIGSDEQ